MAKNVSQKQLEVGRILAEWNPIGVPAALAADEYQGYIPRILAALDNEAHLMSCLKDILVNDLGLEYDSGNEAHVKDLRAVCQRLQAV